MTAEKFHHFWYNAYPATVPLSYMLKSGYAERWVRFHSLPESKRYPESEAELAAILARQNTLIEDLIKPGSPLLLLTGKYVYKDFEPRSPWLDPECSLSAFSFTEWHYVELDKLEPNPRVPNEYGPGDLYQLVGAEIDWQPGKLDAVLREAANDQIRTFFISIAYQCIIAPYDGGIDLILKDTITRDQLKSKFKSWLSAHPSGL